MKQKELAEILNVVQTQIGKYERGESLPPLDKAKVMKDLFGVSWDDFIEVDLAAASRDPLASLVVEEPPGVEYMAMGKLLGKLEEENERYRRIIKRHLPELADDLGLE